MRRFVLLYHDCPPGHERPSHWDFMLEHGPALRTWALACLPSSWHEAKDCTIEQRETVDAEQLGDHRLAYLDYEGPISGERGSVTRVEAGTYETLFESDDAWQVSLDGRRIRGMVTLRCETQGDSRWILTALPNHENRHQNRG